MLERRIRKQIEYAFYNYEDLKKQGAEYIVKIVESGLITDYEQRGKPRTISRGTESKAIKIAEHWAVKWCYVVERTKERFNWDEGKKDLLDLKYSKNKRHRHIQEELYITEQTLFRWLEEILTFAAMVGIQEGVITI